MIWLVLVAVLAAPALVASYLLLRWLLEEMAKREFLVTFRTDGEIKAKMRGRDCVGFIMKVDHHLIDPDDSDIVKASLHSLKPLVDYLWAAAEGARRRQPDFQDRKLEKVGGPLSGEREEDFRRRIRRAFGQEPIRPSKKRIEVDGREVEEVSSEWFVLAPGFYRRLVKANSSTWLERWFGVVWVGFPPFRTFGYFFRWIKYDPHFSRQQPGSAGTSPEEASSRVLLETASFAMVQRQESVRSLFFRYPSYGLVMGGIETGRPKTPDVGVEGLPELIQVRLALVFETMTVNPRKTLFRTAGLSAAGEWLTAVSREIRDKVRLWVGTVNYDWLIGEREGVQAELDKIRDLINGDKEGTAVGPSAIRDYGQRVVKITLVAVDLEDPALQTAINKIFQAKREREAATHQAERDTRLAAGQRALAAASELGKADGFTAIAGIPGGAGVKMRVAAAIGEGGLKVVSVGGGGQQLITQLPESVLGESPVTSPSRTGDGAEGSSEGTSSPPST